MIYIKKPLIVSGFFNAAKPTHQKSNVRRSLKADRAAFQAVHSVPGADIAKCGYAISLEQIKIVKIPAVANGNP